MHELPVFDIDFEEKPLCIPRHTEGTVCFFLLPGVLCESDGGELCPVDFGKREPVFDLPAAESVERTVRLELRLSGFEFNRDLLMCDFRIFQRNGKRQRQGAGRTSFHRDAVSVQGAGKITGNEIFHSDFHFRRRDRTG